MMHAARPGMFAALLAALAAAAPTAQAETLRVGPGQRFALPSQAAAAARAGDTVLIAPGRYRDCAVWRAPDLTIAAAEETAEVEISGPVCDGKALFVIAAPRVTLRGLTFRDATAADGNGAGIRAEGADLHVIRTRFQGNQSGILTIARLPGGRLVIEDSAFIGNGARIPNGPCTGHALYVGHWALVSIRRTRFEATRHCHHVKSRAERTEVLDSTIIDGPTDGASYLVDIPNGGELLLARSELVKGPQAGNPRAAVMIGAEGVTHPVTRIEVTENRFTNRQWLPTVFVENRSSAPAALSGNATSGMVLSLRGPGTVR